MTKFNFKRLLAVSMFVFLFSFGPVIYLLLFGQYLNTAQMIDYGIYFNFVYALFPLLFLKFNWKTIDPEGKLNFTWSAFFKVYGAFLIFNLIWLVINLFFQSKLSSLLS